MMVRFYFEHVFSTRQGKFYPFFVHWFTFGVDLDIKGFWIKKVDLFKSGLLNRLRGLLFRPMGYKIPKRILLVRKGTIGDHVVCQPLYLAIKDYYSTQNIDLLTSNGGLEYAHISKLPEQGLFNETINFNDLGKKEIFEQIKSKRYDLVIELPQDLDTIYTQVRNMIFYRWCGIKQGVGWAPGISKQLRNYRFKKIPLKREWEKHADTLKAQGFDELIKEKYMPVDQVELPKEYSQVDFKEMIAIAPGAKFKCKQWPHYNRLAHALIKSNYHVVVIGSDDEGGSIDKLDVTNLCGKLNVLQSRYVLSQVRLLVCNDSGPMHLAYSVGTPLIALFGGRSYPKAWWPPENPLSVVLFERLNYPVGYFGNKRIEGNEDQHLNKIRVEEVKRKIDEILGKVKS